ncbi:hypothetical protein FOL47_004083, partial [Perkinsus chesapeaki]
VVVTHPTQRRGICAFAVANLAIEPAGVDNHSLRTPKIVAGYAGAGVIALKRALSRVLPRIAGSPPARPSNDQPQPSPDSSTRAAAATSVDLLYSEEKAEPETLQEFLGCFAMETTQLMNQHSSDNSPQACIPEVFMYDFSLLPKTGSQEFLLKKSTVISILLDTGAGKSFVKESWVKQNTSFVHDFRRTTDPLKVQCANGTTFYTNRQVSLEVLHDGQPYTWWFYVTALLSHDIICGMDFLRGLSLTLKLAP